MTSICRIYTNGSDEWANNNSDFFSVKVFIGITYLSTEALHEPLLPVGEQCRTEHASWVFGDVDVEAVHCILAVHLLERPLLTELEPVGRVGNHLDFENPSFSCACLNLEELEKVWRFELANPLPAFLKIGLRNDGSPFE